MEEQARRLRRDLDKDYNDVIENYGKQIIKLKVRSIGLFIISIINVNILDTKSRES